MSNTQHAQFSDENGNIYYLENATEDVKDESGNPISDGGDLSEASVKFTADTTRKLPQSGGRLKAHMGSIVKFLSDLKAICFSGSYSDLSNKPSIPSGAAASQAVANNCTTTAAGSVLDARQGKVLMDKANQLSSELAAAKQSFQAGVDTLYSKCSSRGATPSAKTPMAIAGAIDKIYTDRYNAGKKAAEIKTVSKSAEYPMAGANGEQTVDFSVDFGAVSGYKLAYAGITALDTYISNGTIKYVQFSNLRISGTKATWSVHTARGTGGGNNTCTVQGIFIPA